VEATFLHKQILTVLKLFWLGDFAQLLSKKVICLLVTVYELVSFENQHSVRQLIQYLCDRVVRLLGLFLIDEELREHPSDEITLQEHQNTPCS